jgi:hypothetical protein
MVVKIKGLQTTWDNIEHKFIYLDALYVQLLDLADELETNKIDFIGELPTLH